MVKRYIDRVKLNEAVAKKKLTFTELGKEMGVSHQTVYRKMHGDEFTEQEISFLVKKFGKKILLK